MKSKAFARTLSAMAESLHRTSLASGFDTSPAAAAARREKVSDPVSGYEYFVQTYFPHYVRSPHKSQLHEYLFETLPALLQKPENALEAVAAPRGEAKTTMVARLFTLWCIVTGRKRYVILIMDAIDQAYPVLSDIKTELEDNIRLQCDFPEACGRGRVWRAGAAVTANGVRIEVAGSGKKLRGRGHGAFRPDLVILDDIENDEAVRNPEQRDKLDDWLKKAVLHLGGAGQKFDVVYIGTILHYDSVLNRTLNNPLWHGARFKAVVQWPDDMALWDRWESLYRNEGEAAAQAFYEANEAEMTAGAQTSWAARSILDLMKVRARNGRASFDSELQNDPVSGDDAVFAHILDKCFYRPSEIPPDAVRFGALDPSLGKSGAGRDPSAILVGAFDRKTGVLYVEVAQIKKRLPDLIIEDVIRLQEEYKCQAWAVETVQFQEFLKTELVRRGAARGVPVPAKGVKPNRDKLLRIESLQPHIANGLIKFDADQGELLGQLCHFPKAPHDDGPDALHMLWTLAAGGGGVKRCAIDLPPPSFTDSF